MNQLAEKTEKLYFIDLFAGAGGLSEGFIQAGFYPIAHVEMNEFAAKTLVTRSASIRTERRLKSTVLTGTVSSISTVMADIQYLSILLMKKFTASVRRLSFRPLISSRAFRGM